MTHPYDTLANREAPKTVWELATRYIAANPSVKSPHTKRLYENAVRHLDKFLGRVSTVADLTDETLTAYVRHREEKDGAKYATVEREANKIISLWRWAAERKWLCPPLVRVKKNTPPAPTAWNRKELALLFKGAREYRASVKGVPADIMFTAFLMLAFETGERLAALQDVRWSDIDLDNRWVIYRKETRKGRGKTTDNLQRISRKAVKVLRQLQEYTGPDKPRFVRNGLGDVPVVDGATKETIDGKVFPESDRGTLYYHMKRILASVGLEKDRRSMFHRMRRTHATFLYIAGGDPTASLGHYSDQMTRDHYLDKRYAHRGYGADLLYGGVGQLCRRAVRRVKIAIGLW
jgi:integrase